MGQNLKVSEVKIRMVENGKDGLIGWASCVINDALYLNNIAVRYAQDGNVILTFPAKQSKNNAKHHYFNPISLEAAQIFNDAILGNLRSSVPGGPQR